MLQLGKFYPIRGGVEKVAFDLMKGLSEKGIECHMLCAAEEGDDRTILLNEHGRLICTRTWVKACATMISPSMILPCVKSVGGMILFTYIILIRWPVWLCSFRAIKGKWYFIGIVTSKSRKCC